MKAKPTSLPSVNEYCNCNFKTMLHCKLCIILPTSLLIFFINNNRALLFPYCFISAADVGHSKPSGCSSVIQTSRCHNCHMLASPRNFPPLQCQEDSSKFSFCTFLLHLFESASWKVPELLLSLLAMLIHLYVYTIDQ